MLSRRQLQGIDRPLLGAFAGLLAMGLLVLYSASYHKAEIWGVAFVHRQMVWAGVGLLAAIALIWVDYHRWLEGAYWLYGLSILLLLLVDVAGVARGGAQRWLSLGPLTLQPSEFAKVSTILALTRFLGSRSKEERQWRTLLQAAALAGVPCFLILSQPDLGTAIVLVPVMVGMLLIWGIRWRILAGIAGAGLAVLPLAWLRLAEYQKSRLLVFINPDLDPLGAGYTISQSRIAIGSGGLFGKGWLAGTQSQLSFLPERHSDFIFSVVGEEWGFLGVTLVLAGFIFLFLRALSLTHQVRDPYGRLLVTGLTVMLAFHVAVNTAMTIGLAPVVGLPLPFFSYGGSWMLTCTAAIGMILSVAARRPVY